MDILQLKHLISKIFKILPLRESNNTNLYDYIDSVLIQLEGAKNTCAEFITNEKYNRKYLEIVNTINYLKDNDFTVKQCKREVFKCISLLNGIIDDLND